MRPLIQMTTAIGTAEVARHLPRRRPWYHDFTWKNGRLEIRKTAVKLRLDGYLVAEIANWAVWLVILLSVAAWSRLMRQTKIRLAFTPQCPRPWYLIGGAALWAGMDVTESERDADAVVYFDDVTEGRPPASYNRRRLNFACTDISKGHVAQVFEAVFGYPLLIDPETACGPIVVKSEKNGVHDGRIINTPAERREGWCYQRLIDTTGPDGYCRDLRTPCVGGRPVLVWVKMKPADGRFAIHNRKACVKDPAEVFSSAELALITDFNIRMGLDWGGLDILRDQDGRIYIVDVNKTDVGPVIALSWRDKIVSMNRMAKALKHLVCIPSPSTQNV